MLLVIAAEGSETSLQYSEQPIYRPDQDLLGRAPFALELARALDSLTIAKDGFVMAVLGEWGTGKTSVIELTLRFMRHLEMERMSRSKWSPQTPRTFDELETMAGSYEKVEGQIQALDEANKDVSLIERERRVGLIRSWLDTDEEAKSAEEYWRLKFLVDANPRSIVFRFSPWMIGPHAELARALLSDLARKLEHRVGNDLRDAFAAVLQRISELTPMASAGINFLGGGPLSPFASAGGDWLSKAASRLASGNTLNDVREKLKRSLLKLGNIRIVVIIDDLDRLTPREALQMVSLVKSLGDLPNIVYLLSYSETHLNKLLKKALETDSAGFLEKIVQYTIELPAIEESDLITLLDADLNSLLGNLTPQQDRRLRGTWNYIFKHYLKTPRDIRRFVNAVAVSVPVLRNRVDPIELLLVELARIHDPQVYWWIRNNVDIAAD
jgi:predicted KAP-like P-loop ATPase